jgi:hypothetical protein
VGAWGGLIMGFFGAVFAALTMHWQWNISGETLAAPFVVFAAIGVSAVICIRLPGQGFTLSRRAEKAIMWSSIAEGIGLFVGSQFVLNLHRPELLLPVMALIVGLHFLPIALVSAYDGYYVLGGALVFSGVIGCIISGPSGGELAGVAATVALWIAAILAVHRDWRAKRSAAP